jgi:hypothetical protein
VLAQKHLVLELLDRAIMVALPQALAVAVVVVQEQ